MSIPYGDTGRTKQKARTRTAIVAATRKLLETGTMPTVEQAADEAGVSRATAYRYFPNQSDLLAASHSYIDAPSLVPPDAGPDAESRLTAVVERITQYVLDEEGPLRASLRVALERGGGRHEDLPLRQARRLLWVRDALDPLAGEMPDEELQRLAMAIAAVIGVETLIWLTDLAGLSKSEAVELMRWTAASLFKAARPTPGG
ncbi:MAG TPA: TetR/AcrR family transcriptional regulator [Actinomycetota bacterium]|nr:TetR/AcrR family transcriptional regulator [Actinomycetota bacterium]